MTLQDISVIQQLQGLHLCTQVVPWPVILLIPGTVARVSPLLFSCTIRFQDWTWFKCCLLITIIFIMWLTFVFVAPNVLYLSTNPRQGMCACMARTSESKRKECLDPSYRTGRLPLRGLFTLHVLSKSLLNAWMNKLLGI